MRFHPLSSSPFVQQHATQKLRVHSWHEYRARLLLPARVGCSPGCRPQRWSTLVVAVASPASQRPGKTGKRTGSRCQPEGACPVSLRSCTTARKLGQHARTRSWRNLEPYGIASASKCVQACAGLSHKTRSEQWTQNERPLSRHGSGRSFCTPSTTSSQ